MCRGSSPGPDPHDTRTSVACCQRCAGSDRSFRRARGNLRHAFPRNTRQPCQPTCEVASCLGEQGIGGVLSSFASLRRIPFICDRRPDRQQDFDMGHRPRRTGYSLCCRADLLGKGVVSARFGAGVGEVWYNCHGAKYDLGCVSAARYSGWPGCPSAVIFSATRSKNSSRSATSRPRS